MVDFENEIKFQTERLEGVIKEINDRLALKTKLEGAIEILSLLKQKAEEDAKAALVKVEDTAKAVEAEIVNKI
jgi:hypothetical protein